MFTESSSKINSKNTATTQLFFYFSSQNPKCFQDIRDDKINGFLENCRIIYLT